MFHCSNRNLTKTVLVASPNILSIIFLSSLPPLLHQPLSSLPGKALPPFSPIFLILTLHLSFITRGSEDKAILSADWDHPNNRLLSLMLTTTSPEPALPWKLPASHNHLCLEGGRTQHSKPPLTQKAGEAHMFSRQGCGSEVRLTTISRGLG